MNPEPGYTDKHSAADRAHYRHSRTIQSANSSTNPKGPPCDTCDAEYSLRAHVCTLWPLCCHGHRLLLETGGAAQQRPSSGRRSNYVLHSAPNGVCVCADLTVISDCNTEKLIIVSWSEPKKDRCVQLERKLETGGYPWSRKPRSVDVIELDQWQVWTTIDVFLSSPSYGYQHPCFICTVALLTNVILQKDVSNFVQLLSEKKKRQNKAAPAARDFLNLECFCLDNSTQGSVARIIFTF